MMAKVKPLSSAEAIAFQARWRAVEAMERTELQTTSVAVKFLQLCALFESRSMFGTDANLPPRDAVLAERWDRIRQHYGG